MTENHITPNINQARQTALLAHKILVKFQEMGLPEKYWDELAKLSTDKVLEQYSGKEFSLFKKDLADLAAEKLQPISNGCGGIL